MRRVQFKDDQDTPTTVIIEAQTNKDVYTYMYLCPKNYIPERGELSFMQFDVFDKDTIKFNREFKTESAWTFSNKKYEGRYTLRIDSTLIK